MQGSGELDVVICTHNNAAGLAEVLERLSKQVVRGVPWAVTVIDNASTDDTAAVVARLAGAFPAPLRCVREPQLGLTHARLRGVRETTGDWIAFVDDDNLLEPGWIDAMAQAIKAYPSAGGIGGRVRLVWDRPPPQSALDFGFCFAEQDLGAEPHQVDNLVGAGMVLRRQALVASGWVAEPLLPDRVGRSLISGGDVEMAQRVRAAGFELWYAPDARMDHRMSAGRATRGYLLRMNRALGATAALVSLLGWSGGFDDWRRGQAEEVGARLKQAWRGLWWSVAHRRKLTAAAGWMSYALGLRQGLLDVERMPANERARLMGRAASVAVSPSGPRP